MKKFIAMLIVNLLTLIRVIGVFCIVPAFINHGGLTAAGISAFCYLTDLIDGVLARKLKVASFFGSAFDGIADKLFSVANFVILFTITKFAIIPILCEFAILIIQALKFQKNCNIQSSMMGKVKTWVVAFTVVLLYFISDIEKITFLSYDFISYVISINPNTLYGILFAPLVLFEILTLISYFKNFDKCEVNDISKIDIKLKKPKNFKDKWDNFCTLWLNYDFYMKYKDSAGLKTIRRQIKNNR